MITTILVITGALWAIYYLIGFYNERYWTKRGVQFHKKSKVFGPMGDFVITNRALFEIFDDIYKMYPNEPAVGVGSMLSPALYVKDPLNVQHVLNIDFNSFNHRGIEPNDGDQLADNLLFMNGNRWKVMRQNMTPLFTATKLKSMYYILDRSATDFITYLNKRPELLKEDIFNTLTTFCNAAIGAAVFGIGNESIFDSPFLSMALDSMKPSTLLNIQFAIGSLNDRLFKLLGFNFFKKHEEFFIGAIKQVIRKREAENVKKHDFADLCVGLINKGILKDHDTGLELLPTDEILAAQAFFFFLAGSEPSASAMFVTLVELGRNPEVLKRVHEEIDNSFEKYNNKMTYDTVQEMNYLNMVYNEALRMYPPIGFLTRKCVKDTVLPTGNIRVSKGTKIFTPIFEVHHDSKLFTDPETFNPERFLRENSHKLPNNMYMAFGEGKRLCIGVRYATLQVKAGLVYLLRNYNVKTHVGKGGIRYSKQNVQVRPTNVNIELTPRNL